MTQLFSREKSKKVVEVVHSNSHGVFRRILGLVNCHLGLVIASSISNFGTSDASWTTP